MPNPDALLVLVDGSSYPICWFLVAITDGNRDYLPKLYFYFEVEKFIASFWVTNPIRLDLSIVIAIDIFFELIYK